MKIEDRNTATKAENVAEHTSGWLSATQSRARSFAKLALAEARLAAISVAMMAFFGTLAATFVLGAWGLAVAAVIQMLAAQGVSLWLAMLALAAVHGIAAIVLWCAAIRLSANLEFKMTRGHFSGVNPVP